jgi:hypothetical protein
MIQLSKAFWPNCVLCGWPVSCLLYLEARQREGGREASRQGGRQRERVTDRERERRERMCFVSRQGGDIPRQVCVSVLFVSKQPVCVCVWARAHTHTRPPARLRV